MSIQESQADPLLTQQMKAMGPEIVTHQRSECLSGFSEKRVTRWDYQCIYFIKGNAYERKRGGNSEGWIESSDHNASVTMSEEEWKASWVDVSLTLCSLR